jgi:hypothetical protein
MGPQGRNTLRLGPPEPLYSCEEQPNERMHGVMVPASLLATDNHGKIRFIMEYLYFLFKNKSEWRS